MVNSERQSSFTSDGVEALKLVALRTWSRNLTAWLYVPIGIMIILLACFGIDSLIGMSSVSFPASVACLILLFLGLVLCDLVLGDRKTRAVVRIIDIPAGFALRYLNIFFTPSFILLPLSPPIGGVEVAKIIAVFLIGFVVIMAATAYLVRGLQILLGSSKRAITARAEEMGNESDGIPLTDITRGRNNSGATIPTSGTSTPRFTDESTNDLIAPQRAQDPSLIRGTGGPPEDDTTPPAIIRQNPHLQTPLPLTRPQRWAAFINSNIDRFTYLILFLFVGLPIYYGTGYAMAAQLTLTILAYFTALALPANWKRVFHPVLVSAAISVLGVYILGAIRGDSLSQSLHAFKTGTRYLDLWHGKKNLAAPGAGDILVSVLDAGIVALALPMFAYRQELKRHFFAIVIPNVSVSIGSLFGYPAVCYAIGISGERSLAFAARSLTLALATPAVQNLGGDVNTIAALAIMSGILGALVGSQMLDWMRIPEDDYVTRGVTLGGSSSAIATAVLLQTDPRAAALSSLSMSLFGIITLALTSVPAIVKAVDSLVGL
ncbi:LrgB-like family-domain-containing protein [Rhexocercosporidium sp. MPI-PUGE-AT-0058]|nr:LrgB-like family-domain-containing protein [Rhexocercosporidium sp. MPI-PUGE-AT-0058]